MAVCPATTVGRDTTPLDVVSQCLFTTSELPEPRSSAEQNRPRHKSQKELDNRARLRHLRPTTQFVRDLSLRWHIRITSSVSCGYGCVSLHPLTKTVQEVP